MSTLEEDLLEIARYGKVHIFKVTSDWVANVEMHINLTGVTMEIKGRGNTPGEAAKECLRLMINAIEQINKTHNERLKIAN